MEIIGNLVGMQFHPPAKVAVDNMPASCRVLLERQTDNPHDENAVKVLLPLTSVGDEAAQQTFLKLLESEKDRLVLDELQWPLFLGYINRDVAAEVGPILDDLALGGDSNGYQYEANAFINPAGKWQVKMEFEEEELEIEDEDQD